ncbi:MAG: hypothetical protein JWO46_1430 [Nocardioidaceae bacterium]|nr:hypothetical protein [Nocardioidaceae bacterium]
MTTRLGIGALGVLVAVYGAVLLLKQGWDNLLATVYWLAGGVVLHDGVLGIALIVIGALVVALVPARVRAPIAAGLIVLGTVTATAIPVLGRFGARPDNLSLLDRNYTVGWLVFAALVVVASAAGVARATRVPSEGPADPEGVDREPHSEPDRPL